MDEGIYETLITEALARQLEVTDGGRSVTERRLDESDEVSVLARHVGEAVAHRLSATTDRRQRLVLVNQLLQDLASPDGAVQAPTRHLTAVNRESRPGEVVRDWRRRPATPLSEAALLTNAVDEPNLGAELRAELATAHEVDLLCAFVRWHGMRVLEEELSLLRDHQVPFRVITTTYLGSTERRALDELVRRYGAEVKVHYDTQRTRLHAKAWLFRRRSGFDTGFVGSSNLSRSALLDGVEWNVRLSQVATPSLMRKFAGTFATYWNDRAFESYNPDEDRDRLDDALALASGRSSGARIDLHLSGLEVRPYPHQATILEQLAVEREVHDRHRNLVVAATGTGKTVVAALDYKQLSEAAGRRPRLLFVAHRQEILQQSLRTYREVLGDATFGETYFSGSRPERWEHVFASVQSLTRYGVEQIPEEAFEVVVVDEFHHAEARTYRNVLSHLAPRELVGLTATPERTDGTDVRRFFDGHTAAELRLWDALEADLLVPFHYFGVADNVDLRGVEWKRGRYDVEGLENLYTGNDARTRVVLRQVRDKVTDPASMKALGFCVSMDHAAYTARVFTEAGIPSLAVTSDPDSAERSESLRRLVRGDVNVLFTVDMFNEGVDIPEIDTVLFLRPTESATVFLQQLGRGLRHAQDKAVLTALDFVGHQRKEFRFDQKFRALTGSTRRGVMDQVAKGFPHLPAGSQIVLDSVTRQNVLQNIRSQVTSRWAGLVSELRSYGEMDLAEFLHESGAELADIIKADRSWTRLRRDAGLRTLTGGPREEQALRRVAAVAHVDDPDRAKTYLRLLGDHAPPYTSLRGQEQLFADMLFFSLWPDGGGFTSIAEGMGALHSESAARAELRQVVEAGLEGATHLTRRVDGPLAWSPLRLHARYSREEIVTALRYASLRRKPTSVMQGVLWCEEAKADAFFVTTNKSENDFSPTTLYRDYAISDRLFHWESQSTTSESSPTGRRYITHAERGSQLLLFVREQKLTELGAAPYLFVGPAHYESHEGERPMALTLRLDHPLPADAQHAFSLA